MHYLEACEQPIEIEYVGKGIPYKEMIIKVFLSIN
jgi:hypothetical protein